MPSLCTVVENVCAWRPGHPELPRQGLGCPRGRGLGARFAEFASRGRLLRLWLRPLFTSAFGGVHSPSPQPHTPGPAVGTWELPSSSA